ncbi:hypothetical protein L6452_02593 [Arctium lappa]|uniref:Uncharacterized protein n=1 Tax=Arctium lappa TaxID=4217 RepID=A0ACB9FJC9_ARCLA|nr:hypothetical protein L6452_02593 [Arctium lappa]
MNDGVDERHRSDEGRRDERQRSGGGKIDECRREEARLRIEGFLFCVPVVIGMHVVASDFYDNKVNSLVLF